ncbi:DUF4321 domain-containing protein [Anaeroselena agilis]|uniref:DUF4321 domain-containing protein n=1 Tax=Anaeroselena agilis TaxID=3063788 RepID=A0ABU3P100_9FIRM|nr:DUF4321 domain-containing protein [Selenomonadales bacterium 4137-cl]
MRNVPGKSLGLVALFLALGAIIGGIIGEIIAGFPLGGVTPFLVKTYPVFDLAPATVNLYVVKFVVGLSFHPNLISLLGMVGAYFLVRRFS